MDNKEILRLRGTQSIEHLYDKIDRICDDARDNNHLGDGDVTVMMEAWKTIHCIHATMAVRGITL